jgi:hypothetical protein
VLCTLCYDTWIYLYSQAHLTLAVSQQPLLWGERMVCRNKPMKPCRTLIDLILESPDNWKLSVRFRKDDAVLSVGRSFGES